MTLADNIEIICTIISTLSIVTSSIILCHQFIVRISFYVILEDNYLKIYASALKNKMILKNIKIKINKKVVNEDDIFFIGGSEKMELTVGEYELIKMIQIDSCSYRFAQIKVNIEFHKSIFRIVRIRRK